MIDPGVQTERRTRQGALCLRRRFITQKAGDLAPWARDAGLSWLGGPCLDESRLEPTRYGLHQPGSAISPALVVAMIAERFLLRAG